MDHIVFANNGASVMTNQNTYDYVNRLTGKSSALNFNYRYNTAGQRTQVTLMDGSYWLYGYDALGQLTNANKHFLDGTWVAGQQFGYALDTIGNRTGAQTGGDQNGQNLRPAGYTNDLLNRLTSRNVPGYVDVLGLALANNTVTVNGSNAYRKGEYFREQLAADNASSALWTNVTVVSGQATNSGSVFVAQTPEAFGYDADGNLTNDGRWIYTWDAENRLINMTSLTGAPAASKYSLTFSYDYVGRRIQTVVSNNNGSSYVAQYTNRFLYDGWNLVAVLNPQSSLLPSMMWGTDLSGSMQGAGGVGGLLAENLLGNGVQFAAYDGNGNVAALVNAATGTVSANYEYGPFGEVIRATGPMSKVNPFMFSTKFYDWETGLYYYGARYYNPTTGRWPSRDPMGELGFELLVQNDDLPETGGLNLYVFVGNNPLNTYDVSGEYVKSISATPGAEKGHVTVTIIFRVYWEKVDCTSKGIRDLATQKEFDKKAASIWTGAFQTKDKPKVIYDTTTTFESTYGEAGDARPNEHYTGIAQSTDFPTVEHRSNTSPESSPGVDGSISLLRGDDEHVYAHEVGHAMGLIDEYTDKQVTTLVPNPLGGPARSITYTIGVSKPGWSGNIMAAEPNGMPDGRNIVDILKVWPITPQK